MANTECATEENFLAIQRQDKKNLPCRTNARKREGRCYELSFKGIFKASNGFSTETEWKLAHGELMVFIGDKSEGLKNYEHAWVENENLVYDSVLDRVIEKNDYYRTNQARNVSLYSWKEVAINTSIYGHTGPWGDEMKEAA